MTATEPIPLTDRQKQVLDFIKQNMAVYGPTCREIAAAIGARSPHAATVHLDALEKKGHIRRSGKTRGIEVLS